MVRLCNYFVNSSYFPTYKRKITIGRYSLTDIHVNDKLLSKIHTTITYDENEGWILSDGNDENPSTNGTW
jgi:pSer/pThr/pTyr-binding forkhead associated (FHA) protein